MKTGKHQEESKFDYLLYTILSITSYIIVFIIDSIYDKSRKSSIQHKTPKSYKSNVISDNPEWIILIEFIIIIIEIIHLHMTKDTQSIEKEKNPQEKRQKKKKTKKINKNIKNIPSPSSIPAGITNIFQPSIPAEVSAQDDYSICQLPIKDGILSPRFIRSTNATKFYDQGDAFTCYSHAACSAYINSILRIYGSNPPPAMGECFKIANYNGKKAADPRKSLDLLENHFKYGILHDNGTKDIPSIKDILTISIILSFTTSDEGWNAVKNGALLNFPNGDSHDCHSTLLEGYDFNKKAWICKNSWDPNLAETRFLCRSSALHDYVFIKVFWTYESIEDKVDKVYKDNLVECVKEYNGVKLNAAWMDKTTAIYNTDYICEYNEDAKKINPNFSYLGYDIDSWINLMISNNEINKDDF